MPRLRWYHPILFLLGMLACTESIRACANATLPWLAQHFSHLPDGQQVLVVLMLFTPYLLIWNLILDCRKVDLWYGVRLTLLFFLTATTNLALYTVYTGKLPPSMATSFALAPAAFFALYVVHRKEFGKST